MAGRHRSGVLLSRYASPPCPMLMYTFPWACSRTAVVRRVLIICDSV